MVVLQSVWMPRTLRHSLLSPLKVWSSTSTTAKEEGPAGAVVVQNPGTVVRVIPVKHRAAGDWLEAWPALTLVPGSTLKVFTVDIRIVLHYIWC